MDLHSLLVKTAEQNGFPISGAVDLALAYANGDASRAESDAPIDIHPSAHIDGHIDAYDQWLKAGYAASMEYLERGRDRRANPKLVFAETESVFCVARPYPRRPAGSTSFEKGPRYARYLQGNDYHSELATQLEKMMTSVKDVWKTHSNFELKWKVCVDTSAILERSWAALAGLGWIGKNTLLIHPQYGSYLFLAEVLINHKTGRGPSLLPNYCGHCTRCLQACPTQALEKPQVLNSNRCISYWTLEKRGELDISPKDVTNIGPWVAGCDICQEVCPFNLKPTRNELILNPSEQPENATQLNTWEKLILETEEAYKLRVKNSAMKRIKPHQFRRNLALNLFNFLKGATREALDNIKFQLIPLVTQQIEEDTDSIRKKVWQDCLYFLNK